jgi:hypothetical protein
LRTDEVEFRRVRSRTRRKIYRIVFGFVQGQAGTSLTEAS